MKVHVSAKNIIALGAIANQINALEIARHALISCPKYIDKYHRVDLYERRGLAAKMAIFELSSISKKLKRFRTFEWYFRKQLTIEIIWAKYEEIRNFTTVISFSVFTGIGS